MAIKLEIKNLYKIFGEHPQRAFKYIDKGLSKEQILEKRKKPSTPIGTFSLTFTRNISAYFLVIYFTLFVFTSLNIFRSSPCHIQQHALDFHLN